MRINRDFFDNPIVPDYILCKANKERIGILQCIEKCIDLKFNDLDEINFTIYLYVNDEKNRYYDVVDVMKYILLPDVGFFTITSVEVRSEGTEFEYKTVTAKSYECLLAQKYLEEFVINMGTVESIDSVQFYNLADKSHSLLHLILEKCPDWKIGHIDPSLQTMQRSFEISRQDIYSFLSTVAEAFECFFLFDTLTNTINIYKESNVGKDTNIHVSYINLLKNTDFSCSIDNIKTCLTITGSDDLTVREINMGYDKIYNFEYYNSTEFMSKKLYDAYNKWIALRKLKLPIYTSLLSQYQNYYKQINFLTHEKMPSVTGSTNWTEYGLQPLKEQLAAYEQKQAVSMKAGHGDPSNQFYNSEYLPIYNTIENISKQIKVVENQINSLQTQQSSISDQMSQIINIVSMQNNFTEDELKELSTYIREDELNSSNYIVTDTMTDDEKFEMLNDMLKFGENELAKVSVPQLSFSADMVNLFAIPEFDVFHDNFDPGNSIWVTLRDDFSVKARLLSIHVNFYDVTDFSVTFGNVVRKTKDRCFDITEAIKEATSAATSVSFNASYWSQSAKDTSTIGKILDEGLISAGKYLKNGDDSEMVIDTRGIFVNTISGDYAYKDSIFIGGGRILFTDDGWKTVSMSVGRADVTINGITESRFGTFADFVIAGYIAGSTLEGVEIIGGLLKSTNYVAGKIGTLIDLNSGTFEFNANNESKLALDSNGVLTVKGTIKADKGYIGGPNGFTIETNKIYSGKNSFSSSVLGVYIGTDGISLGSNNAFSVDSQGNLISKTGTIGGIKIDSNKIYAINGNFQITSGGYGEFKDVSINGVHAGSNFGSLGYDGSVTWGNFSGNSYYGSNVNTPFSGTCIAHIETLSANYIKANYLDAINANISNLFANEAQLGNLIAEKASIEQLDAVNAKFGNINANNIKAGTLSVNRLDINGILNSIATRDMTVLGMNCNIGTIHFLNIPSSTGYNIAINGYYWREKSVNGDIVLVKTNVAASL